MGSERIPKFGNSTLLREGERIEVPEGFGPFEIVLKSAAKGAARILIVRADGQQPYFGGSTCRRTVGVKP